jgi:hypothetical protein
MGFLRCSPLRGVLVVHLTSGSACRDRIAGAPGRTVGSEWRRDGRRESCASVSYRVGWHRSNNPPHYQRSILLAARRRIIDHHRIPPLVLNTQLRRLTERIRFRGYSATRRQRSAECHCRSTVVTPAGELTWFFRIKRCLRWEATTVITAPAITQTEMTIRCPLMPWLSR